MFHKFSSGHLQDFARFHIARFAYTCVWHAQCRVFLLISSIIASLSLTLILSISVLASDSFQNDTMPDLRYPGAPGSISGQVTGEDGNPIGGIRVDLFANDSDDLERTTVANDQGLYTINPLSAGLYRLYFWDPERRFIAEYFQDANSLIDAEKILVSGIDVQGIDAELTLGGSIQGTVHGSDESLLTSVSLSVFQNNGSKSEPELANINRTWHTDHPNGTQSIGYTITGLNSGLYRICASATISGPFTLNSNCYNDAGSDAKLAQDINIEASNTISNIDIELTSIALAEVSGVIASAQGDPLPGIKVTAIMSRSHMHFTNLETAETNELGQYHIKNLLPGLYTLSFVDLHRIYIGEYLGNTERIEDAERIILTAGEHRAGVNIVARQGGTVTGKVTLSGKPFLGTLKIFTNSTLR